MRGHDSSATRAGRRCLGAALTLVCLTGLVTQSGAAPGFSHASHLEATPDCVECHRVDARGDWRTSRQIGHGACDAAGCHAKEYDSPSAYRGGMLAFCRTCHVELRRRIFAFPPWRGSVERSAATRFALATFDHGDHQRQGNGACAQCHVDRPEAAKPGPGPDFAAVGHETCGQSICHGGRVAPKMPTCAGCHVLGEAARPARKSRVVDPYRVEFGFTHEAHRTAAGEVPCEGCHVDTAPAVGTPVTLPPMAACATCHDGTRIFSTTGNQCGRCHVRPEGPDGR